MRRRAGCSGKYRKLLRTCLVPDLVVLVFVCWPPNAPNWSAAWPPAPLPNKTPIVPRSSCVLRTTRPMPPSRTIWVWPYAPSSSGAIASPSNAWTASKTVPSARRHACTSRRPGATAGAGLPETVRGRSDARWADPLEHQRPGAVRGRPPRTGSGPSQQKHHRRHSQAAPGSPGPSLTPG